MAKDKRNKNKRDWQEDQNKYSPVGEKGGKASRDEREYHWSYDERETGQTNQEE